MEGLFYFGYGFFGYGLRGPFQFSPIGQKNPRLDSKRGMKKGLWD